MNKDRRKRIAEAAEFLEQAKGILEECKDEEQEAYDNLPDSLQRSERGEEMVSNIDTLESAIDQTDEAYDTLSDIA